MRRVTSNPRIEIVLSDDWELRGDGSGNMRAVQFDTIRKLMDCYEDFGVRGSFNVEVMQQLSHLRLASLHPHLRELAEEWETVVKEVHRRGHSVQLHVHPQWHEARYENGRWRLSNRWSIIDYDPGVARTMLRECKTYLEALLSSAETPYRCVAFRSGTWCLAPSPHLLSMLIELNLIFDMSLVNGLLYDQENVKLDYRSLEESFLPFYPNLIDARKVADRPGPIVCIPTHCTTLGPVGFGFFLAEYRIRRVVRRLAPSLEQRYLRRPCDVAIADCGYAVEDYLKRWNEVRGWRARAQHWLSNRHLISDLSNLSYYDMRRMMRDIRRRARRSGLPTVPIVIENHTKNIGDFEPIRRFCEHLRDSRDVDVITSAVLAERLQAGRYSVRCATA